MLQGRFPEMEILWLLTKAWNCGIHLYRYATSWNSSFLHLLFLCQLSHPPPPPPPPPPSLPPSPLPGLHSTQRYKEAEQWCSLGMRFLKHLSQLKPSYEDQVTKQQCNSMATSCLKPPSPPSPPPRWPLSIQRCSQNSNPRT